VLNGQDIVVLLKVVGVPPGWTVRSLAEDLHMTHAGVHRSLKRLDASGLFDLARRRPNLSQVEEFVVHSVRYLFPPRMGGETRGIPTAWAAPPLLDVLAPQSDMPPVWPDPQGRDRGIALEPLHPAVPESARRDTGLGERLALVDALRLGDPRVRRVATELLAERLGVPSAA
jgi:hypothetical protein